ncbi:MAG: hypothetical protein ACRD1Y_08720, partial [Terriglobales bacterium]
MLMTPGLAFFYGGLVGRKNVLAIMMQSFVSMGWTTVIWYLYGYSLCFSGDWHGIIGNAHECLLRNISLSTPSPNPTIPAFVFVAYQMMFAIITPALISGAFTNRVTFKAYMLFLTAWLTFVYFPFVHMVWGGGLLAQWGVKDFAGGIVVHNIAGMAALASPSPNDTIPLMVFIAYQMMFAIITPALISGAFTNRVTFKAYMLFLTAWLTLVYFPFVHMIWGGGFLQQWGVRDFAGGIVVHNIAGIAALASVLYVGKRRVQDRGPHSIPLVALGTGLLWFGWYG